MKKTVIVLLPGLLIALMVGLSVAGVAGARLLPVPAAARHMETASGVLIALCGVVFLVMEP